MQEITIDKSILIIAGELTKSSVPAYFAQCREAKNLEQITHVDCSRMTYLDSAGVAFLDWLKELLPQTEFQNLPPILEKTYISFSSRNLPPQNKPYKPPFLESLGEKGYALKDNAQRSLYLTADIVYFAVYDLFKKGGQRKGSFIQQSVLIGVEAIGIVSLLSLVVGFIIALQAASQLKQFGADVFIANLMAMSMVREMAPIITAIIVAGRSGSAIASEIATMKVTEEIDALKMLAINPIRYLITPKFHAMTVCLPLLNVFSIFVSMAGGLLVAVTYLNLSPNTYISAAVESLTFFDFFFSSFKTVVFAAIITVIGAYCGFEVKGGAEGVGKATTQSVVASIFAVIIVDALFSLVYMGK